MKRHERRTIFGGVAGLIALWSILLIGLLQSSTSSNSDQLPTQAVLPAAEAVIQPTSIGQPTNIPSAPTILPSAEAPTQASVVDKQPSLPINNLPSQPISLVNTAVPALLPTTIPIPQNPVTDQIVIRFAPNTSPADQTAYIESIGGTVEQNIDALDSVVVKLPADQQLPDSSLLAAAEPDYFVVALADNPPSDPLYDQQWALPVIGAPDAWAQLPVDVQPITVAVIDSGICADHPDLTNRILAGYDFVDGDAIPQDDFGHGCGVAGIIAANANDGIGIAGVAPNTRIMPLRVLNAQGIGTYSDVAAAIVYAVDNGAKIINLSLGGARTSRILTDAVDYAINREVLVIAAAGNTGGGVLYPAAYAPVVAVASIDVDLELSTFSSYGPEIDLLAPGRDILSIRRDGGYTTVSGTSFAAPHVSGIAALEIVYGRKLSVSGEIVSIGDVALVGKPTVASTETWVISDTPTPLPDDTTSLIAHISDSMGIRVNVPDTWIVNEYINVGLGYSFYSNDVVFDENENVVQGALIQVRRIDMQEFLEHEHLETPAFNTSQIQTTEVQWENYRYIFSLFAPPNNSEPYKEIFNNLLDALEFVPIQQPLKVLETSGVNAQAFTPLLMPFSGDNDWYITGGGGYDNGFSHVGYSLYGLDFARGTNTTSNLLTSGETPLSLGDGRIVRVQSNNNSNDRRCIDVKLEARANNRALFLELCHIQFEPYFLDLSEAFLHPGHPLGTFATDGCGGSCTMVHVHIAAYESECRNQAPNCNPWDYPVTQRIALPFSNQNGLALSNINFTSDSHWNGTGPYRSDNWLRCTDTTQAGLQVNAQDICSDLRASDINRDGIVDITDYSILVSNFLKTASDGPNYNPDSDVNKDGITDIADYSILVSNFFRIVSNSSDTEAMVATVLLQIVPNTTTVDVGSEFDLRLELVAGNQPVLGVQAFWNFDPSLLEVISVTPHRSKLTDVLRDNHDNILGQLTFISLLPPGAQAVNGTFSVATVRMRLKAATGGTSIAFNTVIPRRTNIVNTTGSVLERAESTVVISSGSAPDTSLPIGIMSKPQKDSHQTGQAVTLGVNVSDAGSGVNYVDYLLWNGSGWDIVCRAEDTPFDCNWDVSEYPDKEVLVSARATDHAGNTNYYMQWPGEVWLTFTIDRTPPTVLIDPPNQSSTPNRRPTFSWQPVSGAVSYEIQFGHTDQLLSGFQVPVSGTSFRPSINLLMTTYYWRVRAWGVNNNPFDWSETRILTINAPANALPTRNLFATTTPTLTWGRITWATGYQIEVRIGSTRGGVAFSQNMGAAELAVTTSDLPLGVYYWRVRAMRSDGRYGGWSAFDSFTVDVP